MTKTVFAALALTLGMSAQAASFSRPVEAVRATDSNNLEQIVSVETTHIPALDRVGTTMRTMSSTADCSRLPRETQPTILTDEENPLDPIRIGQVVWNIVVAGRPVSETQAARVHVLPREVTCWDELENWSAPRSLYYSVKFKNVLGWTMVQFDYRINFSYNGQRNGVGRYLANVTVVPAYVNVQWAPGGYKFNATVEIGDALNLATTANPVAGIELNVNYQVESVLNNIKYSDSFFAQANGNLRQIP